MVIATGMKSVQLWAHRVNSDKHTNLYGFWHEVLSSYVCWSWITAISHPFILFPEAAARRERPLSKQGCSKMHGYT